MVKGLLLSFDLMILGIVTLIFIAFTFLVAIKIIAKYFETKNKIFLYAGISYLGGFFAWTGVALNFISVVFFDTIPSMEIHFFLHGALLPFTLWLWIMTNLKFTHLKPKIQKMIMIISLIIAIIFDIVYITIIFTDTTILGTLINEIQVDYAPFSEIYLLIMAIIMISLGLWLGRTSSKSEDPRIRLKGRLIIYSFIITLFAYILEIFIPIISVIIFARIIVMFTSILFYGGFVLPKWMEKLFLKEPAYQDLLPDIKKSS